MSINWKRTLVLGSAMLIILSGSWLNGGSLLAEAQVTGDDYVNLSAGRDTGISGCLIDDDFGFGFKFWSTKTTALSPCFLVPTSGGTPRFMIRALRSFIDTSYLDMYIAVGGKVPITSNPNWQRINGSVGIELCLPDMSELAFSIETGISIVHYYSYWAWHWGSDTFVGIEIDFYF
jgi:hypothetical protein